MKSWLRWLVLSCALALAGPLKFQAAGLAAAGSSARLALDFVDGDGLSNQIDARNFSSDGSPTLQQLSGSVGGDLASGLLFSDASFFSEALLNPGAASTFAFIFDATAVAPAPGSFADAFSAFLLDDLTGLSLVLTDDPTGNNALFLFTIDGTATGQLQVYQQLSTLALTWQVVDAGNGGGGGSVPEPASWALVLPALLALLRGRRRLGLRSGRWAALCVAALCLGPALAQAEDLTAGVQITRSGLVPNRSTGSFDAQVTVTNRTADIFVGPLKLVLNAATPVNVALYNSAGRAPSGADYMLLPLADGTLAPGASAVATVRLLTYGQSVTQTDFRVEGTRMNAASAATLNVSTYQPAAAFGTAQDTPVGAGYTVEVDGVARGLTDATGRLTVQVPLGARSVAVTRAPSEGGSALLPAFAAGATVTVKVPVDDSKEVSSGSLLRFDQVQQGLLARNAAAVTLRFLKDEQPVRLRKITGVSLVDIVGNYTNLAVLFSLQSDGSLAAQPAAFFQALQGKTGRLRLEVGGVDMAGTVHDQSVDFYLADYRVRVQLLAPPSSPGLPVAGVIVKATVLNTDLRFNAKADATGYVVLPDLAAGNISLNANTTVAGIVYSGVGTGAINKNSLVKLTLRGPQDVLNNVPPISVEPLPANAAMAPALNGLPAATLPERAVFNAQEREERARRDARASHSSSGPRLSTPAAANAVTVAATGGAQNVLAQASAALTLKKGLKKATLRYNVFTAEYPYYVLQQSVYNDVWSTSVIDGNGGSLFEITRQINSRLYQEPVWRSDGSTGEIKQQIDVSALTASADAQVILRATSVNIGDGQLATTVTATLEATEPLLIGDISPSAMPANTKNDGSYYSIPRPGAANELVRTFTLELTKPSGSTLTTVRLDLRDATGATLMTVLQDVNAGSADATIEAQTDTTATLKLRATIGNPASTVAGAPPPARDIGYHFTVKAMDANGNEISDEKDLNARRALWRMPDGLGRYGARDAGGDDWISRGAYTWLGSNSGLLREIDDVSGEHGRNIGHKTHARGTDIDSYHFYRFPGAVSGGQNHTLLTNDVVLAFQTLQVPPPPAATAALARVNAWLAATRTGLTNLAALASVSQLIHCDGIATQGLADSWCQTLIRTGVVTRTTSTPTGPVTQTLTLGGSFSNAKMLWQDDHNNHVHVTLNPAQIGE